MSKSLQYIHLFNNYLLNDCSGATVASFLELSAVFQPPHGPKSRGEVNVYLIEAQSSCTFIKSFMFNTAFPYRPVLRD